MPTSRVRILLMPQDPLESCEKFKAQNGKRVGLKGMVTKAHCELIGLLRAERVGRVVEEVICYRVILLGITKTSLNTQSFIFETGFQETTRVLAKIRSQRSHSLR
ncbi:hypothetical protein Fmac_029061 [Flemingia macrophylla]|uniref:Uncharacterized protein n=1 Tax=Flemingia macrophylla TaxID=520843 RepID=A0ABD1L9A1_9FABA